ncbi:MAG: C40 family peptidase, partial [Calditrichaeota bacterium]|nr:C40 family peptidase [Calditrichota bacterium]
MSRFSRTLSLLMIGLTLILWHCQKQSPSTSPRFESLITEVKQEFAPDRRVAIYEVEEVVRDGYSVLRGETNLPAAHQRLLDKIAATEGHFLDSIAVLPDPALGARQWALVNNSVANIRSRASHSAELATQALLGTPLNVFKRDGSFSLVQTPDGYIGWVDNGAIVRVDAAELKRYKQAPRVVFLPVYGFAREQAASGSAVVSDLVSGGLLEKTGRSGTYFQVRYPDGRQGFVSMGEAVDYEAWLAGIQSGEKNLIKEARAFMGVPYLWGGTSTKGVDCSGFTKAVYLMNGVILPRDASQQVHVGTVVDSSGTFENLRPGDLLFFGRAAT